MGLPQNYSTLHQPKNESYSCSTVFHPSRLLVILYTLYTSSTMDFKTPRSTHEVCEKTPPSHGQISNSSLKGPVRVMWWSKASLFQEKTSIVCCLHLPFLWAPTPLLLRYVFLHGKKKKGHKGCTILIHPQTKDGYDLKFNFFPNFILFKSGKKGKKSITSFLNPHLNLKSKWMSFDEKCETHQLSYHSAQ